MRISIENPENFAAVFESVTKNKLHRPVSGLTTDSREVKSGDLYIALEGEKANGHEFIADVEKLGAVAALVNKASKEFKIQQIRVDNPIFEIGKIANEWRSRFNIPVIGITGSNGKTSTKELLVHVLSDDFNVHATEGNFNTHIGLPLTLFKMDLSHNISILEMGASTSGEIEALCNIAMPTHGLITNIAPAHLEGFGSIENIAYEKASLFRSLESDGIAFFNKTDDMINDITIIDDTYNANLSSSLAALEYLSAFSSDGRKIFVFGDMFELGNTSNEQHRRVGERCSELGIDSVYTIGDHTKHTDSAIRNGVKHSHFNSKKSLIDSLKEDIQAGDKILFKGSRCMAMEKVIEGVFDT